MAEAYSLWLEPPAGGAARARAARAAARLAARHGGPSFPPHVTLLSCRAPPPGAEARVVAAARELAGGRPGPPVAFTHVACGEMFYQCVYLEAELGAPLAAAHEEAKRLLSEAGCELSLPNPAGYLPHLSLLYGLEGAEHADARAAAAARLAAEEGPGFPAAAAFAPADLVVRRVDGPCAAWREVARLPFLDRPLA